MTKRMQKIAGILATSINRKIDTVFSSVETVPKSLVTFLENNEFSQSELKETLSVLVKDNQEIYGCCIAFAPYTYKPDIKLFAPYAYNQKKDTVKYIELSKSYDYTTWEWYKKPAELNHSFWTEPYFDEGAGDIFMCTYSVPFYKKNKKGKNKKFYGVTTADMSLTWLDKFLGSLKETYGPGFTFIASSKGTIISYPLRKDIVNTTIFELADKRNDPVLKKIGERMIRGETGLQYYVYPLKNEKGWIYFTPVLFNNWSIATFFPTKDLMKDLIAENIIILILSVTGLIAVFIIIIFITHKITRPLRVLADAADNIISKNFEVQVPVIKQNDEIGRLANSFESMRKKLIKHIETLKKNISEKERMQSEMEIARKIQMSLIPDKFPAYSDRKEFEIFAIIQPAMAVGGDIYDHFLLSKNRFCFAIGDVSGKSVPAALFMAITKTLLKSKALPDLLPHKALTEINRLLCAENKSCMFVTFFLCVLNLKTGELEYTNAGHNSPFLLRNNGLTEKISTVHGPPLGIIESTVYSSEKIKMRSGDRFLLYTDGVTEAVGKNNEAFEEERLLDILKNNYQLSVNDLLKEILRNIMSFSEGLEQFDDIALEIVEYKGN